MCYFKNAFEYFYNFYFCSGCQMVFSEGVLSASFCKICFLVSWQATNNNAKITAKREILISNSFEY
ncbi:hypothetical protein HPNQ4110_0333 [Helicobacter pylori NQ4110]|nr:hypothetical protein HPNQ4110_0333 [Helicobacter pylori NQ4110]